MTTATMSVGKHANRIRIDHEQYEEQGTARAVIRERVKFAMVHHLRAFGQPVAPTKLADAVGASPILVGKIASEAPRTFTITRSASAGHSRSGEARIGLHPHLA